MQISPNGLVSFGNKTSGYFPQAFPLDIEGTAIIAPFWSDVDTTAWNESIVYYHQYNKHAGEAEEQYLNMLSTEVTSIQNQSSVNNRTDFQANWALVVTWDSVPPYTPTPSRTNEVKVLQ